MVLEIMPNIYKLDIPIPKNPLKSLNSYVIKSAERTLVIDTGLNRQECRAAMDAGLEELGVDLANVDFFITHMHADHSGLVAGLMKKGSVAYCSAEDAEIINMDESHWETMRVFVQTGGFPAAEFQNAIEKHPAYKYRAKEYIDFTIVNDGDSLTVGDYQFVCVKTPGHTRGHMCLYEKNKKFLISGDHILADITPNISLWSDRHDPLHDYLESLEKVRCLDVQLVLPGHRSLIKDFQGRIDELKRHHRTRADEVLMILSKGPLNAYEVAAQMTWDMTYDTFEEFPVSQKWFAAGEALAHLKYLEGLKDVKREVLDNTVIFSR
ncbi:MAG: MBL fold metallo-hydrolase [Clostridiales bacterium]|jgi:glyoxylase-like metal-dependent hydrolase (beta-lactamase superfamily II)|nr:MBL fold metallo-hydrolase [Clostridiales bacterium]